MDSKVYFPREQLAPYLLQTADTTSGGGGWQQGVATSTAGARSNSTLSGAGGTTSPHRLPRVASVGRAFILPTERRIGTSNANTGYSSSTTPEGVPPIATAGAIAERRTRSTGSNPRAPPPGMAPLLTPSATTALPAHNNLYSNVNQSSGNNKNSYPTTPRGKAASLSSDNLPQQNHRNLAMVPSNSKLITSSPALYQTGIAPDWRLRVRMRTVGVGLVLALNIGTDPPDAVKPHPCAVLQCWMDPRTVSRSKAKEWIGERLEQQYAVWQLALRGNAARNPVRYRRALDPTVDDVRALCLQLRRQARNERVLLHYNGHGVPRPTENGEIWVFDKNHTEYIPLAVADLKGWLGRPSMVVLDCSAAGILLPYWTGHLPAAATDNTTLGSGNAASQSSLPSMASVHQSPSAATTIIDMESLANQWVQDTIVLAPCRADEVLPMHPDYPADIFTSCLTTPIPMALRWFVRRNPYTGLDFENLPIPGKSNDRKTPLGELNWIFTAITDSIAWNVLPRPLFQRLFRQDLLVASMFRNFLLADRILRSLHCTPVSHPPLPPGMAHHPLWQAWDLVCENLLFQLASEGIIPRRPVPAPQKASLAFSGQRSSPLSSPTGTDGMEDVDEEGGADGDAGGDGTNRRAPAGASTSMTPSSTDVSVSSPFFTEQLTAFEVWLQFIPIHKQHLAEGNLDTPEQLPVVLQVLLSQTHRIRALILLRQFLQLGPWAVNAALSLGIFPYILKLLQSPEYKSLLVSIWASILSFDPSCRVDLLKDGAFPHFVAHVMWGLTPQTPIKTDLVQAARERTLAAFCLAVATHRYPAGQTEVAKLNLHINGCALLSSYEQGAVGGIDSLKQEDKTMEMHLPASFRLWIILCLANMTQNNPPIQHEAYATQTHTQIMERSQDASPDVRAAVACALGCLLSSSNSSRPTSRSPSMQELASRTGQKNNTTGEKGTRREANTTSQKNTLIPPPGTGGFLPPQANLGLPTTTASFNPGAAGPTHWQTSTTNAPPGLNPIGQFLAPGQGQRTISLPNPPNTSYSMHPPPLIATIPQAGGFLVAGATSSSNSSPPQFLHSPSLQNIQPSDLRSPLRPSVFEDHSRLELDLVVLDKLVEATKDASVLVRHEAALGIARAVGKYTEAFVSVASGLVSATTKIRQSASSRRTFPIPRGLERRYILQFEAAWQVLRKLQHEDPFPKVAKVANDIVSVVHEHLLRFRMEVEKAETSTSEDLLGLHPKKLANAILAGIDEEINSEDMNDHVPENIDVVSSFSPRKPELYELRRVASEFAMARSPIESAVRKAFSADDMPLHYSLPESEFYEWKKKSFDLMLDIDNEGDDSDPLSPSGAALAYQEWRNTAARDSGVTLAKDFEVLAPKPPKPSLKTIESLLEDGDDEDEAADQAIATAKAKLKFRETEIIRDNEGKMTSMLAFHPYEDVIMACGAGGKVSLWSTETREKLATIENGNPSPSRMTYSTWMNEESSSLFVVGCDDGSIRVWGDLIEPNGEPTATPPTLVTAFYAASMNPGQVGRSGLVCEWQSLSGTLLSGGNSDYVACWDMESEKNFLQLETNSEACITTMTTAWDFDALGSGQNPPGYRGLGPDVILAGFSNGAMKIFDLRASRAVTDMTATRPNRSRITGFSEHKNWIVNCAFTGYGNRYEFISGTTAGDIKAWDLRMSRSVRTFEAHRSGMTTMAVHSKIPLVATGTSSQFIKLFSPDGSDMQTFRYHEKMRSHRIGPVSCLAFHQYKPLMATGATDTFIGIYSSEQW